MIWKALTNTLLDFSHCYQNSPRKVSRYLTSLAKEVEMLDHYLKLEQLRFGFTYRIGLAPDLNKDAIEVPVLLLQPAVENAVKHGISGRYEKGQLDIDFTRSGPDLIATIADNGEGFDPARPGNGLGLKLTRDRMELLNKTMEGQEINMDIDSSSTGTSVIFLFKNWLA